MNFHFFTQFKAFSTIFPTFLFKKINNFKKLLWSHYKQAQAASKQGRSYWKEGTF